MGLELDGLSAKLDKWDAMGGNGWMVYGAGREMQNFEPRYIDRRALTKSAGALGEDLRAPMQARAPRYLCRGPALFLSGPALCQGMCGARAVSVSELGTLQRSLSRRSVSASVLGPGGLCRSLRRGLAVSASGAGALWVGPGALSAPTHRAPGPSTNRERQAPR